MAVRISNPAPLTILRQVFSVQLVAIESIGQAFKAMQDRAMAITAPALPQAFEASCHERSGSYRPTIRSATKGYEKLMRRLHAAISAGDYQRAHGLKHLLLKSKAAKIAAVRCANAGMHPSRRLPTSELPLIAATISPYQDPGEPVQILAMIKPNGTERPIHSYGLKHRGLQTLVARVLHPFTRLDERQFLKSGGRNAAVASASEGLGTKFKWVIEADIKDFYLSVDTEQMKQLLPLSGRISDVVIASDDARRVFPISRALGGLSTAVMGLTAQQGLPQGSISSPLVGEIVIAQILKMVPREAPITNYADNFLIKGRTRREVVETFETLVEAVRHAFAGRFSLISKTGPRRVDHGVDFLGYNLRTRRGVLACAPSQKNVSKFKAKVGHILVRCLAGFDAEMRLTEYVKSWLASFKFWSGRHLFVNFVLRPFVRLYRIGPVISAALQGTVDQARSELGLQSN